MEVLLSYALANVKQRNFANNAKTYLLSQSAQLHNKDKTVQCSKCTNVNDDCHALPVHVSKTTEPTRCAEYIEYDSGSRSSVNNEVYTDSEMMATKQNNFAKILLHTTCRKSHNKCKKSIEFILTE